MARSLGGTDADKIDLGTSATLNPTTAMTFACWAYATSFPNAYNAIFKRSNVGGSTFSYAFQPKSTGQIALYFNATGGGGANIDPATTMLSTNTWYNLAFTLPASGSAAVYVNGVSDGTVGTAGGVFSTSVDTGLGFDPSAANSGWAGRLADCAIWNLVLTTNELLALAKGARPFQIRPTALVGYWPLTGLQSPEPDLSGNANNGTLTGTANASGPPVMQFTPRWPLNSLNTATSSSTGTSFQPAWVMRNRIVVDGIGI